MAGETFPAFPAHAQPAILRLWLEAHIGAVMGLYLEVVPIFRTSDSLWENNYSTLIVMDQGSNGYHRLQSSIINTI